jgi:hypothetical protein
MSAPFPQVLQPLPTAPAGKVKPSKKRRKGVLTEKLDSSESGEGDARTVPSVTIEIAIGF